MKLPQRLCQRIGTVLAVLIGAVPLLESATEVPQEKRPSGGAGLDRDTAENAAASPRIMVNYTDGNDQFLAKVLHKGDRLAFQRLQVLTSSAWPAKAVALKQSTGAEIIVTWPSWQLAKENEGKFAPHADMFGYDIESKSPREETRDTARTVKDVREFLTVLSEKYRHPVKFSCGLNHSFGSTHLKNLAQADEVHIHCNGMLREYPAKDRQGFDYVQWVVATAQEARRANPNVGLWFGAYVPGMPAERTAEVVRRITEEMQKLQIPFEGFSLWSGLGRGGEASGLNAALERIRPSQNLSPEPRSSADPLRVNALPKLGVNYVYHAMDLFIRAHGGTPGDYIAHQNEKLARLGPVWVRSAGKGDATALHWATVEPKEGVFDFTLHDARVRDAQRRGLFLLENVDFSHPPEYASVPGKYFDDRKYLDFLEKVVERYDGDGKDDMPGLAQPIRFWEIGNEPGTKKMFRGTAEQYAHVLKISYDCIKRHEPTATVLIGGWVIGQLREDDQWQRALDFFDRMLAAGGGAWFDVMNYHEYTDDCDFLTYYHVRGFKQLLQKHGLEKPFWITEANTKLQKDGKGKYDGLSVRHTLERQAQDAIKRPIVAFDAGVDVFFWHGLDDIRSDAYGVGLFDEHEKAKPAFSNLQLLARRLAGFRSIQRIKMKPDSLYLYRLETGGGTGFVLWTESEDLAVDLSACCGGDRVELTAAITQAGKSQPLVKTVSKTSVAVSRTPLFVDPIK